MRGERIRACLHNGTRVYGTHVASLTNPLSAKMLAGVPYDFIFICNEHMPIDRTETSMLCQFYALHGISPIVRISAPDPHEAAMALDAGAQGIVVPYIETVAEVQALVGAVKYRPIKGRFLHELLAGTRQPAPKTVEFLHRFNRDNYLIIGVESVAAYENLDALLAVPGVDGVFMGPHDLTVSMEIPEEYEHPAFLALVTDVVRRARAANLGVGIHYSQAATPDESFVTLMQEGMNWVLYGADVSLARTEMIKRLANFRAQMGDAFTTDGPDVAAPASCLLANHA